MRYLVTNPFIELLKMVWGLVVLAYVFLQACAWPQHVFALDSVQATSDRSTFQQRQQAKSRDNTVTLRGLGSRPVNFTASIMKAKASITGRRVYHAAGRKSAAKASSEFWDTTRLLQVLELLGSD